MIDAVGIDKISFYTTDYYIDMDDFAKGRDIDIGKFRIGLGQEKMSIITPREDIVTMGCEAARDVLSKDEAHDIALLLFATESGFDFSKSAGIYLHKILGLNPRCRVLEVKQACYAATGALQLACDFIRVNPHKKALVISADIAWYGFQNAGEVTQGCGAIAMLVTANPRVATVRQGSVFVDDIPDFYRPSYAKEPVVDGKLSIKSYKEIMHKTLQEKQYDYCCFHMPFATMGDKANKVMGTYQMTPEKLELAKKYGKVVGNIYNGSLYLSLLSVLIQAKEDLAGQEIGMFSYGSGAIGEFFSLKIVKNYLQNIPHKTIHERIENRKAVTFEEYLKLWSLFTQREESQHYQPSDAFPSKKTHIQLEKITDGHRIYGEVYDL